MSKTKKILIGCYIAILSIAVFASLSAATYAWFSGNRTVSTNLVKTRTGAEQIDLYVSSVGGAGFKEESVCDLVQVNQSTSDAMYLLPVSTADLKTFLYNDHTVDNMANDFTVISEEEHIYHGRIYIKAAAQADVAQKSTFLLYFDESEQTTGLLASAEDEKVLKAARLGLVFTGKEQSSVIFKLRPDSDDPENQIYNTVINGELLGKDQVLTMKDGNVVATKDPSLLYKDYVVVLSGDDAKLPEKPIIEMNLNEVYQLDVYFYLEGCDPDCSDQIRFDLCDLHLAFYGILSE